jgi:LAO/AO transport system kinase
MLKNGWFADNRKKQTLHWMRELIESRLKEDFYQQPQIKKLLSELEQSVNEGKISVRSAVNKVFKN